MVAGIASIIGLVVAARFPLAPIESELRSGEQLAVRGGTADAALREDRVTVGWWFDGTRHVGVEWVAWLSPRAVSRRLGFLARREGLEPGEVQRRWDAVRESLDGTLTFVVRLSAYPRVPTLDLIEAAPAYPSPILRPHVLLVAGRNAVSVRSVRLDAWVARDPKVFTGFDWCDAIGLGESLGERREPAARPYYQLGDYHAAWHVAEVSADSALALGRRFSLRIVGERRERNAPFRIR